MPLDHSRPSGHGVRLFAGSEQTVLNPYEPVRLFVESRLAFSHTLLVVRANWIAACSLLFLIPMYGCSSNSVHPAVEQPDRILVIKSTRTLSLMKNGRVLKSYAVALGRQPIGPKEKQGDHKTPEGH